MQTWRNPSGSSESPRGVCAHHALPSCRALLLIVGVLASGSAAAASLQLAIRAGDAPLADAVISLHPLDAPATITAVAAQMEQIKSEFTPRVLVVPVGSTVTFPNRDKTRHHVYSFSPAKRFELPLADASTALPVTFETPGVVTVGCNIHDWMLGYVIVLDTPHHARSDSAGAAEVELPTGRYQLRVWHERLPANAALEQGEVVVKEADNPLLAITLSLPPVPAARGDERIRALQEKLRRRDDY